MHGPKPFRDENLSLGADGLLYHVYRIKKGLLKALHQGRCQGPP